MRSSMTDDEDWRPKLSQIDDPIADDYWEYLTSKGKRRISRLTVGRPAPWPKARAWYCPLKIEGHTDPEIKPVFGEGPVDALMNAMNLVRRFFEEKTPVPGAKPAITKRKKSLRNKAPKQVPDNGQAKRISKK
jgi:hypothetical protein